MFIKRVAFVIIVLFSTFNSLYSQKIVKIGAFNFYPAIFKDHDGKIKGFYVEAFKEIEKKEHIQIEYVFGSWNDGLKRIKNQEIDLMVSVAHSMERASYMDYSTTPLITVWGEVYVATKSKIDGILSLEGKTIAIMKSDANGKQLKELTDKLSINCTYTEHHDFQSIFESIAANKVDAGVVNNTFGAPKSAEYDLRSSGIVFNPFDIYLTVPKDKNKELLKLFNEYLKKWKHDKNSKYNLLRQKWSHGNVGAVQVMPEWLETTLITIAGIILILIAFIVVLRIQVKKATEKVKNSKEELQIKNEEYETVNEKLFEINKKLIIAKDKAEENERLKTAFLQNMSHEIRTPLNAISGFSSMLGKPTISAAKQKSFVTIIQNSSTQLLAIVSDILTISALETKQEKIKLTNVCINDLLTDLLALFKPQADNQALSLYMVQQLGDKQSEIKTDKSKITQILTNLLSNALKFTSKGIIEFGYTLKDKELEFYVKDSGIGIKPELYDKIFERFRQADKSIQLNYGGTGLGLSITKGFIELLKGKIWLQSKPDEGSIFYFTIPYDAVNPIETSESNAKSKHIKTVLIAEDEEYNYLLIEELLNELDLHLIHAKNGKEAVAICEKNNDIDLILMDIKMPFMNGHEAAIQIKKHRQNLPIIAQSAYALDHEIEYYKDIFDGYITKPINQDILIENVKKLLYNN